MKKIFFLICIILCIGAGISKAQYTNLFDFNGINGAYPDGGLTLSGNVLYGMTQQGGINGNGNIFSIHTDGTGDTVLFEFDGINGKWPNGSLTLSLYDGVLYGMTGGGGTDSAGTIFSINSDGTGYNKLLDFNGANGFGPEESLTLDGGVLYGMTSTGGNLTLNSGLGYGTIFSINTDGTGYNKLHDFDGTNGRNPRGNLTPSGNVLYGMTRGGNIFSINTDGTGFNSLFVFNGTNGSDPQGSLTLSGNVLYGATRSGGTNFLDGTIFSINTDGTGFTNLHNFNGMDGKHPIGRLELVGNVLYGTAYNGGTNNIGILYSLNTDGTGFANLHHFNGTNGGQPRGYLTLSGGKFYGMAGGGVNGKGVVFSFDTGLVGINEAEEEGGINVFPNPSNTIFTISYQANIPSNLTLTTTDANGKLIYKDKQESFSGKYFNTIDLSQQPKGVYFIEIIYGGQKQSKKIVSI